MRKRRIFRVHPGSDLRAVRATAEALRQGFLAVIPTETVYGLVGDPRVNGILERMFEAKQRDCGKPIPFLAAGIEAVTRYGATLGELELKLASRFWPGPLTLVLRVGGGWEGFRVPDHEIAMAVLRETGGLLRATSANLSGAAPALTAEEAVRRLGRFVDVVLDAGLVRGGIPSTVAKVENGKIRILREGAIPAGELTAEE